MFTSDNNYIRHYGTSVIYDAHYVLCIAGITLVCCAVHKEPRRAERMTTGFDKHITRKRSILPWPRATARSSAQIASLYRRLMPADVGVYRRNSIVVRYIFIYIRCAFNPGTRLRCAPSLSNNGHGLGENTKLILALIYARRSLKKYAPP